MCVIFANRHLKMNFARRALGDEIESKLAPLSYHALLLPDGNYGDQNVKWSECHFSDRKVKSRGLRYLPRNVAARLGFRVEASFRPVIFVTSGAKYIYGISDTAKDIIRPCLRCV